MRGTTLDTFQEMDQIPMMRPIVKAAYRVDLGYRIPEYISIAFREALDGKRGPVYLDLPGDILAGKVDEDKIHWVEGNYRTDTRPAGDPAMVRKAVELLANARKPLVLTGSGVIWSRAEEALRKFHRGHRHPVLHYSARPRRHSPKTIRARFPPRARPRFAKPM